MFPSDCASLSTWPKLVISDRQLSQDLRSGVPDQVVDLFDSILRGYPIGTFIVIEEPASEEDITFGSIVINAPRDDHALIIVDGLQRITALSCALSGMRGRYEDKRFGVYYDIEKDKFTTRSPNIRDSMLPVYIAAT